jgi:hypothetical protein
MPPYAVGPPTDTYPPGPAPGWAGPAPTYDPLGQTPYGAYAPDGTPLPAPGQIPGQIPGQVPGQAPPDLAFQPNGLAANPADFGPGGPAYTNPPPGAQPAFWDLPARGTELFHNSVCDYENFYSCKGLTLFGLGLGTAAVFANTSMDQHISTWYQSHAVTSSTNNFAKAVKNFGEGGYTIPAVVLADILGPALNFTLAGPVIGEWGDRSVRAFLVGGPPLLATQYILGPMRPTAGDEDASQWKPFNSHYGASGHAFVGAVPFMTAAKMSDDITFKFAMYGLSTLAGWSRINDNAHFTSQVLLGWWIAYLSCSAVDDTERGKQSISVVPLPMSDGVGMGVQYRW